MAEDNDKKERKRVLLNEIRQLEEKFGPTQAKLKKVEKEKIELESKMQTGNVQVIRAQENDKNKRQAELIAKKALLLQSET